MVTTSMTHEEYRNQLAQQNLSTADRVSALTAGNERLDGHRWTDDQIQNVPTELVQFAYENSAALRKEFLSLETFAAYWKSMQRKK